MPDLPGSPLLRLRAPHARPKGHLDDWTPQPAQAVLLDAAMAVLDRYRDHLPLGPRAITYQLLPDFVPGRYPHKEALRKRVSDVLTLARRAGVIPWPSIDDGRTAQSAPWTLAELPGVVADMQADRQAGQPYRIEVWVEAKGNLARIGNNCAPYGIPALSGSGSVPVDATRAAGHRVALAAKDGQPTLLLVVADFDPAGVKNIARPLTEDAAQFAADFGAPFDAFVVRQLALTEAQAVALPEAAREELSAKTLRATPDWPLPFKAEVEALDPDVLDGLVEDALAHVRDDDALDAAMAAEPGQRLEAVRALLDQLEGE